MDSRGYDESDWKAHPVWTGECATRREVDMGLAIFAIGDTVSGKPLTEWTLPQPVIWYDEEEEFAAIVVQAESHEAENGDVLEVLGVVLPTGRTAVTFIEDVEAVDGTDPVWVSLVQAELEGGRDGGGADGDDAEGDDAEGDDDDDLA